MDEQEMRFELLKAELSELQQATRSYDAIRLQVRSWAITVGTATAGILIAKGPRTVLLGVFAALAFALVDAGYRALQTALMDRYSALEDLLAAGSVQDALASPATVPAIVRSVRRDPRTRPKTILKELVAPTTVAIYGLVVVAQVIAAVL